NPLADDSIELPEDLDSAPEQSEPNLDDAEDLGGPELASPSSPAGKSGSAERPRLMPDRPSRPIVARSPQTARTLDDPEGDLSGDPLHASAEEQRTVGQARCAKEQMPARARPGSRGPAISIVDARDAAESENSEEENREALDGFVAKDANSRRAASRTLVIR